MLPPLTSNGFSSLWFTSTHTALLCIRLLSENINERKFQQFLTTSLKSPLVRGHQSQWYNRARELGNLRACFILTSISIDSVAGLCQIFVWIHIIRYGRWTDWIGLIKPVSTQRRDVQNKCTPFQFTFSMDALMLSWCLF